MKKLTLALSAAVALAASGSAIAQQANLDASGTVPSLCTLSVVSGAPILLTDNNWQKVGEVTGECNSGLQNVTIEYTAQTANQGGTAAAFVHDDNDAWIEFQGRVIPPGGTTAPFPVDLVTYPVSQGNGQTHDVEFNPAGVPSDKAGNYTTTMLVEVFP